MKELKKITQEELNEVIRLHKLWLKTDHKEGGCADLNNCDLFNVKLRNVNLSNANLSNANLSNANLSNADLRDANLSYADLKYSDLRYADLSYADLCSTCLHNICLYNTDLQNSVISYNDRELIIDNIFQVPSIGSRNDITNFYILEDGNIFVRCGCFRGMIDEFESQVRKFHQGNRHEKEYLCAIELAKSKLKS